MNKKPKIVLVAVLFSSLVASFVLGDNLVFASEFEGSEAHWTNVCSTWQTDPGTVQKCNEYRSYLSTKAAEKKNEAANAQSKIDSMQGDIEELSKLSYEYTQNLNSINAEVDATNASIAESDAALGKLETQIEEQGKVVDARTQVVLDRMVDLQVLINTNKYVSIVMGSEDLVSFIQKSKSVGEFTEQDNQLIEELNEAIAQLEADKAEQVRLKEMQETQKAVLVSKQEEAQAISDANDTVYASMLDQTNNLAAARNEAEAEASSIGGLMPSVPMPPYVPPVTPGGDGNTGGEVDPGGNGGWGSAQANFYSGWYDSSRNIFSAAGYTGQCTWYVFGRANEMNGGAYTGLPTGNAAQWIGQAQARGLATGNAPRSNSIMVWGTGGYGHVAYVESYDGNTIRVSEGNVNSPGGGLPMWTDLSTAIQYTLDSTMPYSSYLAIRGNPIGFIYL